MHQPTDVDGSTSGSPDHTDDAAVAGTPVVVRRNAGLAALVGAGASAIAIAYLWRASASGAPLDWVLCLVMVGTMDESRSALMTAALLGAVAEKRARHTIVDITGSKTMDATWPSPLPVLR